MEAVDGGIGKIDEASKIDEATYDVGSSYIVVDTGPWFFGKKVLLRPASSTAWTSRTRRSTSTG